MKKGKMVLLQGVWGLGHEWWYLTKRPGKVNKALGVMLDDAFVEGMRWGMTRSVSAIDKLYSETKVGRWR